MNTTMKFSVTGQRIELTEPVLLVAGTMNIYTAAFVFDSALDGYTKTAVFRSGDVEREQLLTDDACVVPWEVLLPGAYLKVGVYGTRDGSRLPTIWTERTQYINAGAGPTEEAAEPSPTLVEQLTSKVGNLDALKTEDKSSVVAAVNEIWESGGGGTGGGTTDHSKLINRGAADQHPMSAITGLADALAGKQPAGDYLTQETDPTVPAWSKAAEKPVYTASEVGADPSGTAASQVSAHNTGTDTYSDIRLLIQGLTDRLNALADSDDITLDQLSEVVAYIKSNRELIAAITTDKVSVADIVDNLTTNFTNKPLSAAQGVALKAMIDGITIPDKLPNPNALTFTGAVTGSYDGSEAKTIEIPSGGGGGVSYRSWSKVWTLAVAEDIAGFEASNIDLDGKSEIMIVFISDSTASRTMVNGRLLINGVDVGKVLFNSLPLKKDSHSFIIIGRADDGIEYTTMAAKAEYQTYPWQGDVNVVHRMVRGTNTVISWIADSTIEITQASATLGQGVTIEIYVR